MVPAFALGYITYDPKFPDVLLLWAVNNFFFVCFAEEVIFRGFLQNTLKKVLQPITQNVYLPIGITSVIFGLAHFQGGVSLMVLATIAGFFYGYAYHKTGRILCAMLVHFGLNLFHLLVFAYPAAVMIK
jgi:membrane protease YdiL (CAAX protease family)